MPALTRTWFLRLVVALPDPWQVFPGDAPRRGRRFRPASAPSSPFTTHVDRPVLNRCSSWRFRSGCTAPARSGVSSAFAVRSGSISAWKLKALRVQNSGSNLDTTRSRAAWLRSISFTFSAMPPDCTWLSARMSFTSSVSRSASEAMTFKGAPRASLLLSPLMSRISSAYALIIVNGVLQIVGHVGDQIAPEALHLAQLAAGVGQGVRQLDPARSKTPCRTIRETCLSPGLPPVFVIAVTGRVNLRAIKNATTSPIKSAAKLTYRSWLAQDLDRHAERIQRRGDVEHLRRSSFGRPAPASSRPKSPDSSV